MGTSLSALVACPLDERELVVDGVIEQRSEEKAVSLDTIKPARLEKEDTIGLVSPSWGAAGLFPHRVEQATKQIEALGYKLKIGRYSLNHKREHISDTPDHRVADIHDMFRNPEIKAIIAAIGGDHSSQLLPLLDFDLIRNNPKIFMGYSDITVLNIAIWKMTGIVTFNGPAIISDFAEYPAMFSYTRDNMLRVLTRADAVGKVMPSSWWTEEFLDWENREDLQRPRARVPSAGWRWIKSGKTEGVLVGGSLESLQHLRGTPYWPDFNDAILFIETSELGASPTSTDSVLMAYENMGIFPKLKGLLVGRAYGYDDVEKEGLRDVILERTKLFDFPIITDMDFGHTSPQFTLPVGVRARIDTDRTSFEIIESAVS